MRRFLLFTGLGLIAVATLPLAVPAQEESELAPHLKALESKKKEVRLAAIRQLGSHGTAAKEAVPALGKLLQTDADPAVSQQAAVALVQIGWPAADELARAVRGAWPAVQQRALLALVRMGPQARDAVEVLREVLREGNPTWRPLAAQALGDMGPAAEPVVIDLCQALRSRDKNLRQAAARALHNLGPVAVPGIRDLLKDELANVRLTALEALTMLGPEADGAVADVTKMLKDQDPRLRIKAAETLGAMGPPAREAIPSLLANMKDRDVEVQQATFQALLRIGSEDVPGLMDAFRKLNEEERWAAPIPLRQFGPAVRDAVKPLIRDLQAADEGKRLSAALTLGEMGKNAREAAGALQKALNSDASPLVRQSAAIALARISGDQQEEVMRNQQEISRNKQFQAASIQVEQRLTTALKQFAQLTHVAQVGIPIKNEHGQTVGFRRPLNRQALFNPQIQSTYNQIVDLHLMASAHINTTMNSNPKLAKEMGLGKLSREVSSALANQFQPEGVPALIRGMHLTAYYDLGFC